MSPIIPPTLPNGFFMLFFDVSYKVNICNLLKLSRVDDDSTYGRCVQHYGINNNCDLSILLHMIGYTCYYSIFRSLGPRKLIEIGESCLALLTASGGPSLPFVGLCPCELHGRRHESVSYHQDSLQLLPPSSTTCLSSGSRPLHPLFSQAFGMSSLA